MNINSPRRRKAISPVLATVILIAITLIAAIAIAGFVFGLFGTFTNSARVLVTSTSIPHGLAVGNWVSAENTGTANTNVIAMSLTYGGATCNPAITTTTLVAGAGPTAIPVTANTGCGAAAAGEAFTGSLSTSNGASVPLVGIFS